MIRLKPEGAAAYIQYHAEVWPEVAAMIRACNIRNYSIWSRGLDLFAYFEYIGEDYASDMAKMEAHGMTQRWWDLVKPLMDPLPGRGPGEFWAGMEEIFYLE